PSVPRALSASATSAWAAAASQTVWVSQPAGVRIVISPLTRSSSACALPSARRALLRRLKRDRRLTAAVGARRSPWTGLDRRLPRVRDLLAPMPLGLKLRSILLQADPRARPSPRGGTVAPGTSPLRRKGPGTVGKSQSPRAWRNWQTRRI